MGYFDPPTNYHPPKVEMRIRSRRVPLDIWRWAEAEPRLRARILSVEFGGQDQIDPDKPYEVVEEEAHAVVKQEG